MPDRYTGYSDTITTPAKRSTLIVPGDAEIVNIPKAILVGGGGNVVGQLVEDAEDRTFVLQAGYHPLRFRIIRAAGTTATGLIGLD